MSTNCVCCQAICELNEEFCEECDFALKIEQGELVFTEWMEWCEREEYLAIKEVQRLENLAEYERLITETNYDRI